MIAFQINVEIADRESSKSPPLVERKSFDQEELGQDFDDAKVLMDTEKIEEEVKVSHNQDLS